MSEISPDDLRSLLLENATLADRLEASEADRERIATASVDLREELESVRAELEEARGPKGAAEEAREYSLQEERDRLSESLALANARLTGEPGAPVLPPAEVSELVDRLLTSLDSRLSGMTVSDAEVQLKVGVEKLGETQGFVVPSSECPPEVRESLHQITVRLTPSPEQET